MAMERILFLLAGTVVLASLAVGWWVTPWAFLVTAFVGANLILGGIADWCPMMFILKTLGVRRSAELVSGRNS